MRCGIAAATRAAALLVLLAGAAGAQGTAPQDRIDGALARAGQVGIPVALLENKIAEGRAKGVSLARIAAAIERRLGALERARDVLRADAAEAATLSVAADAVEAGVGDSVLRALAASAPADRRTVAFAALTELVTRGQAPQAALDRVQDALKRGPDALSNLPAEASSSGRGNSGNSSGNSGNSGSGDIGSRGRGNSGAGGGSSGPSGGGGGPGSSGVGPGNSRGGPDAGPPSAVPAPGQGPQAGRPDNPGRGSGGGNTGSGNSGGGGGNPGRGNGR